jgi:hypothetical protein
MKTDQLNNIAFSKDITFLAISLTLLQGLQNKFR